MNLNFVEKRSQDTAQSPEALHRLRGAAALVDRAIARALEPHGITTAQYEVLKVMAHADDEALPCSELGKRLSGPSSDVTRLLDRLESVALVSRKRDEQDRRMVHTRITDKGREVLATAAPDVCSAEHQALSGLSASDRATLTQLLSAVQLNLAGN